MSDVIIVALIGFGGSVVGSLLGILASNKLVNYRIEQLEKKVDKHNNVIERVYRLEKENAIQNEKIEKIEKKVGR